MKTFLITLAAVILGGFVLAAGWVYSYTVPPVGPPETVHYFFAAQEMGCAGNFNNWQSCKLAYKYADVQRLEAVRVSLEAR